MIQQKQIAEKAGLSYATVSRAFTNSAKVSPAAMHKIREAMRTLGISSADELFSGKGPISKMILVVAGDIALEFFANIIAGIYEVLYAHGFTVALCISNFNADTELQCMKQAEESGYGGIIMITAVKTPALVSFLQYAKTPVVLVNRHIRSLDLDIVRIDNYRGGYMAASHLLDNGHRKIAHLSGPQNSAAPQDRLRGFADAMDDNGLTLGKQDIVFGDLSRESGKEFANWLVERDYTAVFVNNADMTAGMAHQLSKLHRSIPGDYSVICFDDSPLINEDGLNITSVSCDPKVMGRSAAEVLLRRLDNPLGDRSRIIYSPKLTLRGSVRPCFSFGTKEKQAKENQTGREVRGQG